MSVPEVATKAQDGTQVQIGQVDTPISIAQVQGVIEIKRQEEERTEKSNLTTKPEEQLAIQTLVTLPTTSTTPSQALHKKSVEATPLQSSRPSLSTSKVDDVTSFGHVNLDELIVLPKFDLATITIEQMSILQDALARKKHQELIKRENRKR